MLLPSTLPSGPRPRLQRMGAFNTSCDGPSLPPQSPATPQGIDATCSVLQSVLGTRSQKTSTSRSPICRPPSGTLVVKRPPPPARLSERRKRRLDDHLDDRDDTGRLLAGHGYGLESRGWDVTGTGRSEQLDRDEDLGRGKVSTPKRVRKLPPLVPFGLDHDDFLNLDEALDDTMALEDTSTNAGYDLPIDEGYGTMDLRDEHPQSRPPIPRIIDDADLQDRNPQQQALSFHGNTVHLQPRSRAASDIDAMSIGTPNSGADFLSPAQALSPQGRTGSSLSPHLAIPEISLADSTPPLSLPDGQVPSNQFEMDTTSPNTLDSPEIPLPTLPCTSLEAKECHTRPRVTRLPSLAHSDPFLPTPSTPTHPARDPFEGNDLSSFDRRRGRSSTPEHAAPSSSWTDSDDRALVAMVVDKLRMKKSEWDACARAMGADGHGASLGRRWRELVGEGCVGLKFRYGGAVFAKKTARGKEDVLGEGDDGRTAGRRISIGSRARRGDVRAVRWT